MTEKGDLWSKCAWKQAMFWRPFQISLLQQGHWILKHLHAFKPPLALAAGGRKKLQVATVGDIMAQKNMGQSAVVEEEDPFVIKGVIKASYAVIGSRFHGLVSSLSQAIPSLCVGWSHKYEALFNDYNFPEGLLSAGAPDEALIKEKMKLILDKDEREGLLKKLESASQEQKQLTAKMWEKVFEVIS